MILFNHKRDYSNQIKIKNKIFKILGEHSHEHSLLSTTLLRKANSMTVLCTVETMEEFDTIRREHGCVVHKTGANRGRQRKPGLEQFRLYSCKFNKYARYTNEHTPAKCGYIMLPMPDNDHKGKIRIYVQGMLQILFLSQYIMGNNSKVRALYSRHYYNLCIFCIKDQYF